jgi:hypothetical protein
VAVAAMAAEGYLPSSRLICGRDWAVGRTGPPGEHGKHRGHGERPQAGGATLVAAVPGESGAMPPGQRGQTGMARPGEEQPRQPAEGRPRTEQAVDAPPEQGDVLSGANAPGLRRR